jgi:hypothetical protein
VSTRSWIRPAAFFALLLPTYAYFSYGARGANTWSRLALTFAIVEDHSFVIDRYQSLTKDYSKSGGHYYSNKAPGSSFFAVPFYAAYLLASGGPAPSGGPRDLARAVAIINVGANVIPIFACVWIFWRWLGRIGTDGLDEGDRLFATAAFALGAMSLPFAGAFLGHGLAMFFLVATVAAIHRTLTDAVPPRTGWIHLAGFSAGLAVLTDYVCLPAVAVLSAYLAWHWRRAPRLLGYWLLGGAVPGLALGLYDTICFGSPFTLSVSNSVLPSEFVDAVSVGRPSLSALWGLTLSPYRGLFWSSPFLLLGLLGLPELWRRDRTLLVLALIGIVPCLVYVTCIRMWNGGATYLPRYLMTTVPFLALLFAVALPRARGAATVLVALSVCNMWVSAAVTHEVDQAVRNPLFAVIYPLFLAGIYVCSNWLTAWLPGLAAALVPLVAWALALVVDRRASRDL